MRPLLTLPALLLALPAFSGEGRRVEIPALPATIATPLAPTATQGLPTAAIAPVPQAGLQTAAAASAIPSAATPAAAASPAATAAASDALKPPPAAAGLPKAESASAAAPNDDVSAAEAAEASAREMFDRAAKSSGARFDVDGVVKRNAGRELRGGVFIQQEQEGSLVRADLRDSSGNVFRYYRPVDLREEIADQVHQGLSGFEKAGVALKRAFRLRDRKGEYAAWESWPLRAKLEYLDKLEKAVVAEKGKDAAWKGKVSLLLERKPGAPDFITLNPHMEAPPPDYRDAVGAKFLQPEVVSDKEHPASSVNQAIGRTRTMIAETGHAGTQYHVFVKASPETLRAQLPRLQAALQLLNDALFARAAQESFQNVTHPSLLPWHRGRSERVASLLNGAAADPHVPQAEDADSEKHAFIGLRYWGTEDGKLVISFELRGAAIPFKAANQAARDMGSSELPRRDYTDVTRWLTLLSLYAEQLAQGRAPALPRHDVALDLAGAEKLLSERAAQLGIPDGAYYGVAEFGRKISDRQDVPPGLLFPFAASAPGSPALRAYMDALLKESARLKAGGVADRTMQYVFWSAYKDWAAGYEARQRGMVDALWRASAGGA